MVDNNLSIRSQQAIVKSEEYLKSSVKSEQNKKELLSLLSQAELVLAKDINDRSTAYVDELSIQTTLKKDALAEKFQQDPKVDRISKEYNAAQVSLEELRAVNGGMYPKNISPVLYSIPLIILGIGEWYVNYSTFAVFFVPAIAIVVTIGTAIIFAIASHVHGCYIKQLGEILHPSVDYRQFIDRKIALILATIALLVAFALVLWVRYEVLSEQFGVTQGGPNIFGATSDSKIFSKLAQTAGLNFGIWALGTLYAWELSERVPNLRDTYRTWRRLHKKLDKLKTPFKREADRLDAALEKQLTSNQNIKQEYQSLLEQIKGQKNRIIET
jgi:hypothetical protein